MAIEVAKIELKTVQDASGLEDCIAALTAAATFSTIAGRPISSGLSSALIAVPIANRNFEDGPVLAFLANTVA